MRLFIPFLFCLIGTPRLLAQASAVTTAYTVAGIAYKQNFDSLPATGTFTFTGKGPVALSAGPVNAKNVSGWQIWMYAGSNPNANFTAGTGSASGNGAYSFGVAGSGERALGSLATGTGIYAIGLVLTNQTGTLLNRFSVSFAAEQWRKGGSTNKNTWSFRYKTGNFLSIDQSGTSTEPGLNFCSSITSGGAGSLNGNLPANRQLIQYTVDSIVWKPGEQLVLRWDDMDESGNDDAVAMDDFSFTAELISSPPAILYPSVSGLTADTVSLSAIVDAHFSPTNVAFGTATDSSFTNAQWISTEPDPILPGKGRQPVKARIGGLAPGTKYFYKCRAENARGIVYSIIDTFNTPVRAPEVITRHFLRLTDFSISVSGHVTGSGGAPVTAKGIVWAVNAIPTLADHPVNAGKDTGRYTVSITDLPTGSIIYIRTYALNAGGVSFGDTIRIITPTLIRTIHPIGPSPTNAVEIRFSFQTTETITGLNSTHFSLYTAGISGAYIKEIKGQGSDYTITVYSGSGDGELGIRFNNDRGLSLPVRSTNPDTGLLVSIDKTPPQIRRISIPDRPMKLNDTIPVQIDFFPDSEVYDSIAGTVHHLLLLNITRNNDSVYSAKCIVTAGSGELAASENIPVTLRCTDRAGNTSMYTREIIQSHDVIDASMPYIISVQAPAAGLYKAGDSLLFLFRLSEPVIIENGSPSLTLTIGAKSRNAIYTRGSGSDSLVFRYSISKNDIDTDGIKTAGTITLNRSRITDPAGNIAKLSFLSAGKNIRVDGTTPQPTSIQLPAPGEYTTGDTLCFRMSCSKKILFNCADSLPYIEMRIGNKTRKAVWQNNSTDSILLFSYPIEWADMDTSGIQINALLTDPTGCLHDVAGNLLSPVLPVITTTKGIRINTPTLRLEKIIPPENALYKVGDTLWYTAQFNETVQVRMTINPPYIKVTIGKTGRQARYRTGSGTSRLSFAYVIQSSDTDSDGIETAGSITQNGSSLTDSRGNDAPLYFNTTVNTRGIRIDATPPVLSKINFTDPFFYKEADTVSIQLQFSEPVTWDPGADTPVLLLSVGTLQRKLYCQSQPGSALLVFRYRVQKNDLAKKGITLNNKLQLPNSLLTDLAGNTASLLIGNDMLQNKIFIDAQTPLFTDPQDKKIEKCIGVDSISLSALLSFFNSENGEALSWNIEHAAIAGTLSNSSGQVLSNGKNNVLPNIYFILNNRYPGTDTLHITISDGINRSEKNIFITVLAAVQNNRVGHAQITCAGKQPVLISGSEPLGGDGSYHYTWEMSGATDSLVFSQIQTISTKDIMPAPLQNTTWFRRKVYSGACTDSSAPVKIEIITGALWEGTQDNDWNNTGNWCLSKTPDAFTDAHIIFSCYRFPPLIRNQGSCNNLFIRDSGSLNITGSLGLYGRIESARYAIDATKGQIRWNGNIPQVISGLHFRQQRIRELVLDNVAGSGIQDSLTVQQTLLLTRGRLETGGHLFLEKEARIAAAGAAASVTGAITAACLLPGGRSGFRLIGNPFSESLALHTLTPYIDITGEGGSSNGFTDILNPFPSAYRLDPLRANDSTGMDVGWTPFTHTNGNQENAWKPYNGIRLFFRGNKGQGLGSIPAGNGRNGTYLPQPVTLMLTGSPQMGELWTGLPGYSKGTYHCVSNPYLSAINLQYLSKGKSIGKYYWLWNPLQGKQGGYTAYPFRCKTILPAFGAFITRSNGDADNHLLFSEQAKTTETANETVPLPDLDDLFFTDLRLESDSMFYDRVLLLAIDTARTSFDPEDAEKFMNPDVSFYSIASDGRKLSADARPLHNRSVIPLGIQNFTPQGFSIRVAKAVLPAGNTLMLHDIFLDKWMKLATDSSYQFNTTNDSLSYGNNRFEIRSQYTVPFFFNTLFLHIHLWPVPATAQLVVRFSASEKGNTTLRVLTISGQLLKQAAYGKRKEGDLSISVADLPNGVYIIEARCGVLRAAKHFIKQ